MDKNPKDPVYEKLEFEIDAEQILLHSRNIMLYGEISTPKSEIICQQLLALDILETAPIALWINSCGGVIASSLAIVDTIAGLKSPVYTFVCGNACSGGALVALAGEKRVMTANSCFMLHDPSINGYEEYADKMIARAEGYALKIQKLIFDYIKKRTLLTDEDLEQAKTKELWLFAKDCKKKGIVNHVTKGLKKL